jgi:probable F420-dependent oxidoreductase
VKEIFALTPETMGLGKIPTFARRVEALGFDGLFVSDAKHDGLLLASQALGATTRLVVGTSVLVAYPRSPMIMALAGWDLQRFSGGRFELGIGTQVRQNIEERYSARWLPPASGMREYVGALRAIFQAFRTGEPLEFIGEHYRFTRLQPFFNPGSIDEPDPPIMLGAIGPRMLSVAGECADGVLIHPSSANPRCLNEIIRPHLELGAQGRAPGLGSTRICANELVATGPDLATVASERARYRDMLAFVFSTPAYWASLELFGWKSAGERMRLLAREGRWSEMGNELPNAIVDEFLVSACYDDLPSALARRFTGLVDRISIPVPVEPAHDDCLAIALREIRRSFSHGVVNR